MRERTVPLTPGKRVLFLTKNLDLIRRQLRGEVDLTLDDVRPEDLLDDINTDVMTPAWVCFDYEPEEIAKNAYVGLLEGGQRVIPEPPLTPPLRQTDGGGSSPPSRLHSLSFSSSCWKADFVFSNTAASSGW